MAAAAAADGVTECEAEEIGGAAEDAVPEWTTCARFPSMPVCGCTRPCREAVPRAAPDQVHPRLFVGDLACALNAPRLRLLGVTHVVNASNEQYARRAAFRYLAVPVPDEPHAQLAPFFAPTVAFVREAWRGGGAALIHCKAGVSRSVALALACILAEQPLLSVDAALATVQAARPRASPNAGFMRQLEEHAAAVLRAHGDGSSRTLSRGSESGGCSDEVDAMGLPDVLHTLEMPDGMEEAALEVCRRLVLWRGDITTLKIDAIVAAGNNRLAGCRAPGHCIDAAIFLAAGEGLFEECRGLGGCATGDAKTTAAYALPCRRVIHTVGPQLAPGEALRREHDRLLARCYAAALDQALLHGVRSVALCCISTGVFGFPQDRACRIALTAVARWLAARRRAVDQARAGGADLDFGIDRIVFDVFSARDLRLYAAAIPVVFGAGRALSDAVDSGEDGAM